LSRASADTVMACDKDPLAREAFTEPAYNFRMSDLQAAVGRPQLRRLGASIAERRRLAAVYHDALAGHAVLAPPVERADARCNWQSYPTRLRPGAALDQEAVVRRLFACGIASRRGVTNAHQEPAYADRGNWAGGPLPVSEQVRDSTVLLPLFHGMTDAEQVAVLEALASLAAGG
jgi:perosamine synthetase